LYADNDIINTMVCYDLLLLLMSIINYLN